MAFVMLKHMQIKGGKTYGRKYNLSVDYDTKFQEVETAFTELAASKPEDSMLQKASEEFPKLVEGFKKFGDELIKKAEELSDQTTTGQGHIQQTVDEIIIPE